MGEVTAFRYDLDRVKGTLLREQETTEVEALVRRLHLLEEARERKRRGLLGGGWVRRPKPLFPEEVGAVDGALAAKETLGLHLYGLGVAVEGRERWVWVSRGATQGERARARMLGLELLGVARLLEASPRGYVLADGSRVAHLSALSAAGYRLGEPLGEEEPEGLRELLGDGRLLASALASERVVFFPKEETAGLKERGLFSVLLEARELAGPFPLRVDLHLGSHPLGTHVHRWFYRSSKGGLVKMETSTPHVPGEVLAALGETSSLEGVPFHLTLVDRLAKDGARMALAALEAELLRRAPPAVALRLLGPYRT